MNSQGSHVYNSPILVQGSDYDTGFADDQSSAAVMRELTTMAFAGQAKYRLRAVSTCAVYAKYRWYRRAFGRKSGMGSEQRQRHGLGSVANAGGGVGRTANAIDHIF
jgi:hypothetical protein